MTDTRRRWARIALAGAAVVAMAAGTVPGATAAPPTPRDFAPAAESQKPTEAGTYIVQLQAAPVVAYEGGVQGLKATKPAPGEKVNPNARDVVRYADHLTAQHDDVLNRAGGGKKLYDYTFSFNGFAAELSASAAAKVATLDGVVSVTKDELREADTSSTPDFLGLTDEGGIWELLGGEGGKKNAGPGEDVIIGVIDSGIWPESASFSDRDASGKRVYQQIAGWHGKCVPGEEFAASLCNQKLIGAQHFNAAWGGNAGIDEQLPWEFTSVRDYGGHGTHTASTAGGNRDVATTGPAAAFGNVSGIAPRARIAAYKALWETGGGGSGFTTDLMAAIDQAVADGVDVINYSVSGTLTNFADPVEIAFLFAADAGIFVAASAGNSGPASSTAAHPSPWITTVAAATHNRDGRGSVTLGDGTTYEGASVSGEVVAAPVVFAGDVAAEGADAADAALCFSTVETGGEPVLDAAEVEGKIVVCDRGVTARTDKSLAVSEAGGVGMILVNTSTNSINADLHFVPTVHLNADVRDAVLTYVAEEGATATINEAELVYDADAPFTASFSSRGPLRAGGGDLLKPDLTAPGQDVLAAVAPPGNYGRDFDIYSGTSMSAPHVAGLAALLIDLHPDWSPMAVKSALMTTGSDVLDQATGSSDPTLIFKQGAGHVEPNAAMNPGLVFDSGWLDWLAFLCGTSSAVGAGTCDALETMGYSTDASDMNVPSIAIGDLAGTQTVTRTVTNVGDTVAAYTAEMSDLAGFDVAITPASVTLAPGESADVEVTITRTDAPLNAYTGGQLTWSAADRADVRIPVVVRPVALAAPRQVNDTGDGVSYDVTFGYTGGFSATARGIVAATTTDGTVADDPNGTTCSLPAAGEEAFKKTQTVTVEEGTTHARFSLFDDFTDGNDDLDLCVFRGTTQVGASGTGTSAEEVNLVNPAAGDYTVVVQGWGTDGPDAQYTLFHWLLGSDAAGNMTVTAPTTATLGDTGTIDLAFTGLEAGTKYLGSVAYAGIDGLPNPTIVRVDTP